MAQALSYNQRIALAKETTWGTGVNPTVAAPITDGSIVAQLPATFDDGRRGLATADYEVISDAGHGEVNIEGWVYPLFIGHLFMGLFGTDTVTGTGDPYTHEFSLAADPPSYTFEERLIAGANGGQRAVGCKVGSVSLSWDAASGPLTYSAQLMGQIPTIVTPQDPAITEETAFEGWRGTLTSTDLSCLATNGEINFTRELQVVHTGCDEKDPYYINVGPLRVEGSLTLVFDTIATYQKYLNSTRQAITISFTQGGSPTRSITILIPDAALFASPAEFDRGGVGVNIRLSFRGVYDTTEAGPATVTILNSRATAY